MRNNIKGIRFFEGVVMMKVNVTSFFRDTIKDTKKEFNRAIVNIVNQYLKQNNNEYAVIEKYLNNKYCNTDSTVL